MDLRFRLFIDFEFLEKIHNKWKNEQEIKSKAFNVVISIFREYLLKEVYVNTEIPDRSEFENSVFELFLNPSQSKFEPCFEEYVQKNSCDFSMFFMNEHKSWFELAKSKGALCFSWDDYEESISKIIKNCHFKIDLSEKGSHRWENVLKNLCNLPTSQIIIVDRYILNKDITKESIVPIFKQFSDNAKSFVVMTGKYGQSYEERAKICHEVLEANNISNVLYISIKDDLPKKMKFHDRILYGQYFILDATRGFDTKFLYEVSNSLIIAETIFEKDTYNRMIRHKKYIVEYLTNISKPTFEHHEATKFPDDLEITII